IAPDRLVGALTMPEQQIVEIAKALGTEARILIMDEPTASLTGREVERLVMIVTRLRAEGAGIVYISHRLDEVLALADRISVLRDGEMVATREKTSVDRRELIRLMVGRDVTAPIRTAGRRGARGPRAVEPRLRPARRLAHGPSRRDSGHCRARRIGADRACRNHFRHSLR